MKSFGTKKGRLFRKKHTINKIEQQLDEHPAAL